MRTYVVAGYLVLGLATVVTSAAVQAQQVTPDIERNVISENILDSENWSFGISAGLLSIEDFGSSSLFSAKLAYHINEDWYLGTEYSMAKAGLTSFEELSGAAPLLTDSQRNWRFYGAHLGYVVLPGQAFLSENYAFNSGLSVFIGGGNVQFAGDDVFALQLGSQYRLFITDWFAAELTVTDYIFETTILANSKTSHNLALSLGFSMYF
ncbi:outer membrane beta-barrel domain-containing protein [Rheinheimera salexigens]|uniref:Outer membrane beta-barrel domain-containing protein n=1 Tax=Rheinheimera salexigens TaxID=1628148 RepID=A0A1E7QAD0_9GAMM|nr:outer membrane beta-barrel domain-containing protein [Rheinheimera salexigens]